jgi:ribosomal protein S18 acetylase RimI-like enzyme
MPGELSPVRFTVQDASSVAGFNCGADPWAVAITRWITGAGAIDSMQRGTEVWLYYDDADALVGIGAVGKCRRPYPPSANPTRDQFQEMSVIPAIAVSVDFQRQGYGTIILEDLIAIAETHGTALLSIDVHTANPAITMYQKFEFTTNGYVKDGYLKMWRHF